MKISSNLDNKDNINEKGLLRVKLDLKQPMVIDFANKQASHLTRHSSNTLIGMKINQLMP